MATGYTTLGQKRAIKNKLDVKLWMINNQFSRRNLPTETRVALAYRFKELEAPKAKERQLANLKQFSEKEETAETSPSTDSLPVGLREENKCKTLELIAQKAAVSTRTAEQYDAIQRKGTDEYKTEIKNTSKSL